MLLSHFSRVQLCATPETAAHQAYPSLGFSRQEYWSGLPFPSPMHESEKWKWSRSVVSDPQPPHGLQPSGLLHPWDFPSKSTGVGCHCQIVILKSKRKNILELSDKMFIYEENKIILTLDFWTVMFCTRKLCKSLRKESMIKRYYIYPCKAHEQILRIWKNTGILFPKVLP